MASRTAVVALALLAALSAGFVRGGDDVAAQLRSAKVDERIAAVDKLEKNGAKDAESLLKGALKDADWEVVERAATALGERGTAASTEALGKVALEGPVRRLRIAAARALAKLDPAAAVATFAKATKPGGSQVRAADALAAAADSCGEAAGGPLTALLASEDAPTRAAAAAGLHAFAAEERATKLKACLDDDHVEVAAAALESTRTHPNAALAPTLLAALTSKRGRHEVVERRVDAALAALLQATPAAERAALAAPLLDALKGAAGPEATRIVRMLGQCATKPAAKEQTPGIAAETAVAAFTPLLSAAGDEVRAATVRALSLVGSDAALDAVAGAARSDRSGHVRDVALRDLLAARGIGHAPTRDIVKALAEDSDDDVREDALVALGSPDAPGAVELLAAHLKDPTWEVAVAAAVSLGKTHDPAALAPLEQLLAHKDWKYSCAALVGLGHLQQKAAVAHLIDGMHARSATAKLTSYEFLRRLTNDKVGNKEQAWKEWWQKHAAAYQFVDAAALAKSAQKYGYAADPSGYGRMYQDLDVLCFQSRGDHIEKLLDALKVAHRDTRAGAVEEAGVSPFGVYVANCTGEAQPPDLEQVRWFVHTGGYLFCSCWALTYHAAEVRPGFARQLPTRAQVLDLVVAEPCRESPYLTGVFESGTRPRYSLYGSHLIEVLDPERVEVLIDSPECETRWGGGNLAAWWSIGHGLILDSANHFDLQGLGYELAPKMKDAADRIAYAIDTMGLRYSEVRAIPGDVWKSSTKSAEDVRDLSMFRFLTNFVRRKRIAGA
jgi:HEAT repeat protein